jgi:hypothetical protein
MSRLFIFMFALLLLPNPSIGSAQTTETRIVYETSAENFPNPERGFYHQYTPLWIGDERYPQDIDNLRAMRDEGISLLRWYFLIDEYRVAPLDEDVLAFIAAQFATAREAGMKVIPRFAYNFPEGGEYPFQDPDATLERVLAHIDQLKPILQTYSDVIAFMETGFVGAWGEWHSSTNKLVDEDSINARSEAIVAQLLDALPADRMVAIRYPSYKQQLYGEAPLTESEAFSGTAQARMGAHNDCFLASYTDWGTYSEDADEREAERAYLQADNRFVPQGGETCNSAEDAQPYIGCDNALIDLALIHFSALNIDYQEDVLDGWREGSCFDDIARRLGYRFRLIDALIPTEVELGSAFNLHLTIVNDGFASPYNPRGLELVLRSVTDGSIYRLPPTNHIDVRFWLPEAGEMGVTVETVLPEDLPTGDYEVLLNLPDPAPTLYERPEYAIQLANTDVWEAETGFNRLLATLEVMD